MVYTIFTIIRMFFLFLEKKLFIINFKFKVREIIS